MDKAVCVVDFRLDETLDENEFVRAFEARFEGSRAEIAPLPPAALRGRWLIRLHVPEGKREEASSFAARYVERHRAGASKPAA